ncbi:hypothetical protein KKH3_04210 [Pectobacterium actinidiae]|nr:hypothetical protein KKH3_04210 [Pectobacterium actinidiae]
MPFLQRLACFVASVTTQDLFMNSGMPSRGSRFYAHHDY